MPLPAEELAGERPQAGEVFPQADRAADEHPRIEAPLGNDEPLRGRSLLIGSSHRRKPQKTPVLLDKPAVRTGSQRVRKRLALPETAGSLAGRKTGVRQGRSLTPLTPIARRCDPASREPRHQHCGRPRCDITVLHPQGFQDCGACVTLTLNPTPPDALRARFIGVAVDNEPEGRARLRPAQRRAARPASSSPPGCTGPCRHETRALRGDSRAPWCLHQPAGRLHPPGSRGRGP